MSLGKSLRGALNTVLRATGYEIVKSRSLVDFYLHRYDSYEQYRDTQVRHNIRKIDRVWADEATLSAMCDVLAADLGGERVLRGLCHGARNGFEQRFISSRPGFDAIGTDISPTAKDFERTVQWDFHDTNPEWLGAFDFVYSNSLDQSWKPREALATWLGQVRRGGYVVIEHTEAHGPNAASEMDPFGVRPTVVPYVIADWFGTSVAVKFVKTKKGNMDKDVWLFFVQKRTEVGAPTG
jgi:hypothetical protein